MKLNVFSIDFEERLITFRVPTDILNKSKWCFGDKCEVDLSEQINRESSEVKCTKCGNTRKEGKPPATGPHCNECGGALPEEE
ncbi:MAG: hypothetical protein GY861_04630 [bacterium]|nr:hypothetical protein [bacterium]